MELVAGLVFAWITVLCMTKGAPTADSEDASTNNLNGNYILGVGRSLNNIYLRLLGKSLINRESAMEKISEEVKMNATNLAKEIANKDKHIEQLETKLETKISEEKGVILSQLCQMHPCGEWSAWTACSVKSDGNFGIKNRTRECGRNTSMCTFKAEQEVAQTESELCEGVLVCPDDYTLTSGYCFKYFATSNVRPSKAQNECQTDKGHVVNVNTKVKFEALSAFLTSLNVKQAIWINGRRDDVGGKWEYTYGEEPDYVNWRSGQPDDETRRDVCRYLDSDMTMYDHGCTGTTHFVCEIP